MKNQYDENNFYIYNYTPRIKKYIQNLMPKKINCRISVIIMVKDEERCISRCIQSIYEIADEIIIIDTGSTDKTKDIIQYFGNKIIFDELPWNNDFAEIRNKMIEKASGDIIFSIDADEYMDTNTDIKKLKETINILFYNINVPFAICPLICDSTGSTYGHLRRIFRKKDNFYYVGNVHEDLRSLNGHDIELVYSNFVLNHDGYNEEVIKQKNKFKRNLTLLNKMIKTEENNARWHYFMARDLFYSHNDTKVIFPFIKQCENNLSNTYEDNRFREGICVLKGQIYFQEKNLLELQKVITHLKKHYPQNVDRIYLELLLLQNGIDKIYEQINSKSNEYLNIDGGTSFINSNGDHITDLLFWQLWSNMNYDEALKIVEYQNKYRRDKKFLFIIDSIITNIQIKLLEFKQNI